MIDSTTLPDLRILPTGSLVPHEEVDPRRIERLCQRLRQDGRLKNPPIVASIPGMDQFVILDGANRGLAFIRLGIPHIVAQLVSYGDPGVLVDTWYHVVSGMPLHEFEASLTRVTGLNLQECSLREAREALSTNQAAAYIVCESGVRRIGNSGEHPLHDIRLLTDIVGAYKGRADIFRASNDLWEKQVPYYPQITALIVFPRFSPSDIIDLVRNGVKVPTGITRHVISPRAININIPLHVLSADWSLERKQAWLHEWLMERMSANAIRYYAESTFTFDE